MAANARAVLLAVTLTGCFGELRTDVSDATLDRPSRPDAVVDAARVDAAPTDTSTADVTPLDAATDTSPDVTAPVDAPAVDAPTMDAPTMDAPAMDAPTMDAPAMDAPAMDAPAMDAPARDAPRAEVAVDVSADVTDAPDPSILAPRLVAPLSVSRVKVRVRFEWNNAPGMDGAEIQVCRDRGCTVTELVVDADGESITPSVDITPGVHWWRARGRRGGVRGLVPSGAWEFYVTPRRGGFVIATPRQWAAMPDFNGDGRFDLLAGAPSQPSGLLRAGAAYLFFGTAMGFASTPTLMLTTTLGRNNFGSHVSPVGDTNGDGFVDFAVGAVSSLAIFRGGNPPAGTAHRNIDVFNSAAPAGDVNHDGFADVVAWDGSRVAVFLGGEGDLAATPARMVGGTSGVGVGDINSDGFDDVAIQVSNTSVAVYPGSLVGVGATALYIADGPRGFNLSNLALAGDVNADGVADLIATASSTALGSTATQPVVIPLSPPPMRVAAPVLLNLPAGRLSGYGTAVAGAGDFNGDGVDDTIAGSGANDGAVTNQVCVYAGSATGPATTPTQCFSMPGLGRFGSSVGGTGDLDRDGFEDVLAGARGNDTTAGTVRFYRGRAAGLTDPMSVPVTAGAVNANFAASIAAWR